MKEDIGQFAYRAGMKVKITPKTKLYDENFDKIFRKDKLSKDVIEYLERMKNKNLDENWFIKCYMNKRNIGGII